MNRAHRAVQIACGGVFALASFLCMPGVCEECRGDDLECIRAFYSCAFSKEIASCKLQGREDTSLLGLVITKYCVDDTDVVWVNEEPKMVIHYRKDSAEDSMSEEDNCITPDAAFKGLLPILAYFNLPRLKNQYSITRYEAGSDYGNVWGVRYENMQHRGIPYVDMSFVAYVDACTGKVRRILFSCPPSPEPLLGDIISKMEALEKGRKWVERVSKENIFGCTAWIDNNAIKSVKRKLVVPFRLPWKNKDVSAPDTKAFHCWEVPVMRKYMGRIGITEGCVYVRADTGDVLGAN